MSYEMNMNEEKKPQGKVLLPEGWRKFRVSSLEETTSKAGNHMFVGKLIDIETEYEDTVYLVSKQGKRWLLKSLLSACGNEAGQDGVYKWNIADVVGKEISGLVKHEDNEWINREGETIKSKQHKITEFDTLDNKVAWDGE